MKSFFENKRMNTDGLNLKREFGRGLFLIARRFFIFNGRKDELIKLYEGRQYMDLKNRDAFSSEKLNSVNSQVNLTVIETANLFIDVYLDLLSSLYSKYLGKGYSKDEILTFFLAMPHEISLAENKIKVKVGVKRKSGVIPLWNEEDESLKSRREMHCPLEDCVFCSTKTSTWHIHTNNPVCLDCATIFKVENIPEDWGSRVRASMRKGTFKNSLTRAN